MQHTDRLTLKCLKLACLSVSFLPFFTGVTHADQANTASYVPGNPIYDLWDQFYKIEKTNPQQAESILKQLAEKTPHDIKVWKSLTYLQIRMGKSEEALNSVRKAREVEPLDEQLALQEAYLLNQLHRNDEALVVFKSLEHSQNIETATKAKQAVNNLQSTSQSTLAPYFADIYFSPSYEGRFDDGIFPLKLRFGRNFGDQQQAQVYGFTSITRDTQSKVGSNPEIVDKIFEDNAAVLGVGANYQPFQNIPARVYLEVGGSYDLIDRNRDKFRESIVGGVTGYQEWQHDVKLCSSQNCPSLYSDFYGNIATYSREDYDVLADLRLRSGLNLYQGQAGRVQAYGKLHTINDTDKQYYNNLAEIGPGIAWQPFQQYPVTLRVEQMYGKYVSGTPIDVKDTYSNTRVELTFYKGF